MTLRIFVLIIITGLLMSCESEDETLLKNPVQIDNYFPLSQFINEQIPLLEGRSVRKRLVINGEINEVNQILYERDWREEFDWFIQSDINKASLAQAYQTEEYDNSVRYTLIAGERGILQEMQVLYDGDLVKKIIIYSARENTFYRSNATSILSTDDDGIINSYRLESTQKVWFLSPNNLEVQSELIEKSL